MAGSAILGTNLVDSLVPDVIDGIRGDLHPDLGVRQFLVAAVTRTYVGELGSDNFTDAELAIDPQPLVEPYAEMAGSQNRLEPCGIDEATVVKLKEISLTYTEAELSGLGLTELQDFYIRLSDAHGQGIPDTYWRLMYRPFPDRIQDMGWTMTLKVLSTPPGF